MNEKVSALKTAHEGTDLSAITAASEALSGTLSKIGEAMQQAGAEQPAADAGAQDGADGQAKDADFSENPGPENA